jgi:hypothetical protein
MLFAQGPFTEGTNLLPNGDLETWAPNYWSQYNDGLGGTMTWATDEAALQSLRSFKVSKSSATSDAVGWVSDNNADLYWNNAAGNVLYTMRFWAKTSGVNTNPANDDAKIGALYRFYVGGSVIGELFLTVDQSTASTDWVEYVSTPMLVTSEPEEVRVWLLMGKDATGTVWFDNVDCGTDPWSMGVFNADAETPLGWMNWADATNKGFANTVLDPNAHSGQYSTLLYEADTLSDEMVFYSEPVPAEPDTWYAIGVWIRTDSINTGEKWYPTAAMPEFDDHRSGICFFFHRAPLTTNWDLTGGDQFFYIDQLPGHEQTDWTYYCGFAKSPSDAAGVSMRARFNNFPTGYVWYDDFAIQNVDTVITIIEDQPTHEITMAPSDFQLKQNYPNPFNPETIIEYQVPANGLVELNIYNVLGQKVRTLVNDVKAPGTYQVLWDGRDDRGNRLATGMYVYQLRGKNAMITKRMIMVK